MEKFLESGITELKHKLGPLNWQFMPTKQFDPDDFAAFLKLLPDSIGGLKLRHAVEVRHDSFKSPDFIALAREHNVAVIISVDSDYTQIADLTADFVYVRAMGTTDKEKLGYANKALDAWAKQIETWAAGGAPDGLDYVAPPTKKKAASREVFFYVISGFKERNPAAAMALIEKLS